MLLTEMLGAPFPAETTITIAGVAWGQGIFSFAPLYAAVVLGNVMGSSLSFAIGYYVGRPFLLRIGKWVRLTSERLEKIEHNFERSRAFVIILGKFVSVVRVLVPFVAGMNRMRFSRFSLYNTLSAFIWGALYLLEGRYLDRVWHSGPLSHISGVLGIVLGIILTTLVVKKLWQLH